MTPQEYMALPKSQRKTQEMIANLSGCDQCHISRIFSGKTIPSPSLAKKISEAVDGKVSVLDILYPNEISTIE